MMTPFRTSCPRATLTLPTKLTNSIPRSAVIDAKRDLVEAERALAISELTSNL